MHRTHPGQSGVGPPLGVGDRHQAHPVVGVAEHRAVLADRVAVHGGHGGHRTAAGDQRPDRGVVVDHVEVGSGDQLVGPRQVGQLRQRLTEPVVLHLVDGGDEVGGGAVLAGPHRRASPRGRARPACPPARAPPAPARRSRAAAPTARAERASRSAVAARTVDVPTDGGSLPRILPRCPDTEPRPDPGSVAISRWPDGQTHPGRVGPSGVRTAAGGGANPLGPTARRPEEVGLGTMTSRRASRLPSPRHHFACRSPGPGRRPCRPAPRRPGRWSR